MAYRRAENKKRDFILREEDFQEAEANGVTEHVLRKRYHRVTVYPFWTKKMMVTRPVQPTHNRVYSKEILDKAKENGVTYATFVSRITVLGWSEERAATEKPTPGRRSKA
jgi:hypothetical protein